MLPKNWRINGRFGERGPWKLCLRANEQMRSRFTQQQWPPFLPASEQILKIPTEEGWTKTFLAYVLLEKSVFAGAFWPKIRQVF